MGHIHHRPSRRLSLEVLMDAHREELAVVRDQRQVEQVDLLWVVMWDRLKEMSRWTVTRDLSV